MAIQGLQIQNFLTKGPQQASDAKSAHSILAALNPGKDADVNAFEEVMASLLNKVAVPDPLQTLSGNNASLKSVIAELKQFTLTKFGKIDGITISKNQLNELQNILQAAGLKPQDIDSFLSLFKDTGGKIKLSDILSGLQELDSEDAPVVAEIAMLPFIETRLNKTGLDSKTIDGLISDASTQNGINLSRLSRDIKNLSQYQAAAGNKPEIANRNSDGQNDIASFVKKLEQLLQQFSRSTTNTNPDRVNNLMASFTDKLENTTGKKTGPASLKSWGNENFLAESSLISKGMERPSQSASEAFKLADSAAKASEAQTGKQDLNLQDLMKRIIAEGGGKGKKSDTTAQGMQTTEMKTSEFQSVMRYKENAMPSAGKSLPEYVENHVSKQLARAILNGNNEVKFHIKPPDLGRIQMNILQTGHENMKVTILAEQSGTRDMIQAQIQEIKNNLAETGIKIDKIEVQLSSNFGQSSTDERYSAANSGKNGNKKGNQTLSGKKDDKLNPNSMSGINETRAGPNIYSNGRLYLVA